jgi:hypothetical protein
LEELQRLDKRFREDLRRSKKDWRTSTDSKRLEKFCRCFL